MRIIPTFQRATVATQAPVDPSAYYGNNPSTYDPPGYVDVSLETPDQQFEILVGMVEANDAAAPAPRTTTPPWGEPIATDEYLSQAVQDSAYLLPPDLEPQAETDLASVIADAYPDSIPEWSWYNDDQYHGLGVPPGVENVQPLETGHTQITLPDPTIDHGWDAWSGKIVAARVARHENAFPGYMAGQQRGHEVTPIKIYQPYHVRTQQARDLLLAELMKRGVHNVMLADVPSIPYTEQVAVVDPTLLQYQIEIGPEGVLP
jgi:hypothetical protein